MATDLGVEYAVELLRQGRHPLEIAERPKNNWSPEESAAYRAYMSGAVERDPRYVQMSFEKALADGRPRDVLRAALPALPGTAGWWDRQGRDAQVRRDSGLAPTEDQLRRAREMRRGQLRQFADQLLTRVLDHGETWGQAQSNIARSVVRDGARPLGGVAEDEQDEFNQIAQEHPRYEELALRDADRGNRERLSALVAQATYPQERQADGTWRRSRTIPPRPLSPAVLARQLLSPIQSERLIASQNPGFGPQVVQAVVDQPKRLTTNNFDYVGRFLGPAHLRQLLADPAAAHLTEDVLRYGYRGGGYGGVGQAPDKPPLLEPGDLAPLLASRDPDQVEAALQVRYPDRRLHAGADSPVEKGGSPLTAAHLEPLLRRLEETPPRPKSEVNGEQLLASQQRREWPEYGLAQELAQHPSLSAEQVHRMFGLAPAYDQHGLPGMSSPVSHYLIEHPQADGRDVLGLLRDPRILPGVRNHALVSRHVPEEEAVRAAEELGAAGRSPSAPIAALLTRPKLSPESVRRLYDLTESMGSNPGVAEEARAENERHKHTRLRQTVATDLVDRLIDQVASHPSAPVDVLDRHLSKAQAAQDKVRVERAALAVGKHPAATDEQVERAAALLPPGSSDAAKEIHNRVALNDPDRFQGLLGKRPHQVEFALDTGRLRRARDYILATGKPVIKPEEMPPGDWSAVRLERRVRIGRLSNGDVPAAKIQEAIDALPKMRFNATLGTMGTKLKNEPCEKCDEGYVVTECDECEGKGQKVEACPECDGQGRVVKEREEGDQDQEEQEEEPETENCSACGGDGRAVEECDECHGEGRSSEVCGDCGGSGEVEPSDHKRDKHNLSEQRHSDQVSRVYQVNLTTDHVRRLKEAGAWETYKKLHEASKYSGHPVGPAGVGWVRYTGAPAYDQLSQTLGRVNDDEKPAWTDLQADKPGIFVDEVQSDLGQSLTRQIASQAEDHARQQAREQRMDAEQTEAHVAAAQQAVQQKCDEEYPPEHLKKISQVVFGGQKPSEILLEAFHQHLRDRGFAGTPVHLHSPETKLTIMHDSGYLKRNKPMPAHMQFTYGQLPPKMGLGQAQYGGLTTEENESLKGKPVWGGPLRKMAKIHDDPRRPMTVYRIENDDWEGPYGDSGLMGTPQSKIRLPERANAHYYQPLPEDDFDAEDLHELNNGENGAGYYSFGFRTPQHALRWHGAAQMKALHDAGYKLREVRAAKVFESASGSQLFFEHAPRQPRRHKVVASDLGRLGKSQRDKDLRQVASVALRRPDGSVLFLRRHDDGKWTTPGGHLNPGEHPAAGAVRELAEEAGVELPAEALRHLGAGRVGRYLVHCFAADAGDEPEVRLDQDPDQEASEHRWARPDDDEILRTLHSPRNVLLRLLRWPVDGAGIRYQDLPGACPECGAEPGTVDCGACGDGARAEPVEMEKADLRAFYHALRKGETDADRLLRHPDPAERAMALKLGDVRPEHLMTALVDDHPHVRQAALDHPGTDAVVLRALMRSTHLDHLADQLAAARQKGQPEHLELLWRTRRRATPQARQTALALAQLPGAGPTLLRALWAEPEARRLVLRHPACDPALRHEVAAAELRRPVGGPDNLAAEALRLATDPALLRLAAAHPDPGVRLAAAQNETGALPEDAQELLLQGGLLPRDPDPDVDARLALVRGPHLPARLLSAALKDHHPAVRQAVFESRSPALGRQHVLRALASGEEVLAARALGSGHAEGLAKGERPESGGHDPRLRRLAEAAVPPHREVADAEVQAALVPPAVRPFAERATPLRGSSAGLALDGAAMGVGRSPKVVLRDPPGEPQGVRYLVKAYHEDHPKLPQPTAGWAELASQGLYHALGIGHLHQEVALVPVEHEPGIRTHALVIRMAPDWRTVASRIVWGRKDGAWAAEGATDQSRRDAARIVLADFLTGNGDRHEENLLAAPDGRLLACDHGGAFLFGSQSVRQHVNDGAALVLGDDCPDQLFSEALAEWRGRSEAARQEFRRHLDAVTDEGLRRHLAGEFDRRADHLDAADPADPRWLSREVGGRGWARGTSGTGDAT